MNVSANNNAQNSNSYSELLHDLERSRSGEPNDEVERAYNQLLLSAEGGQQEANKKLNTIETCLQTARVAVNEIGLGRTSVASYFLYQAKRRGAQIEAAVKSDFASDVYTIFEGLCKIDTIQQETTSSQAENFRSLLLNMAKDVRVILIRLAEQMELMRQMNDYDPRDQLRIASEAAFLYAPLAHRLGLYLIKSEMEDLSLKFTDRETYSLIARKLAETVKARNKFIKEFTAPIYKVLEEQGFKFEIKGRPKSIHSIWNKMKKKEVEFEDIYDLFAIRIILDSEFKNEKADCWQVYSAVTDIYQPNPRRMRDWISVPKSNGYESLHTTVIGPGGKWVEVQIRTRRMNEIAEKGVAAHWKYKEGEGEQGLDGWLAAIREILETPETDAGNFIDDFKLSLYSKEIFVFTPKGDLRKFPKDATVLDFAYDIHTDVGATCTGARVNGKSVPIRYVMQNGDKVEIITSKNQKPNLDWLNFVVTSKAQKKIRLKVDEEQMKDADAGKELLQRRLKNWKLDYNDQVIRDLLKHYKFTTAKEFYCKVYEGAIDLAEIKDFLTEEEVVPETTAPSAEELTTAKKETPQSKKPDDFLVIDEKVNNVDYRLAKCCNPIMGDRVFGFVTINEGIKIHRVNCPNAAQLIGKYGYRVVSAKWTRGDRETVFPVTIQVTGEDHSTILKGVSDAIAKDLKVAIGSIDMGSEQGVSFGLVSLKVRDLQHLESLFTRLTNLKGIYSVSRLEGKR